MPSEKDGLAVPHDGDGVQGWRGRSRKFIVDCFFIRSHVFLAHAPHIRCLNMSLPECLCLYVHSCLVAICGIPRDAVTPVGSLFIEHCLTVVPPFSSSYLHLVVFPYLTCCVCYTVISVSPKALLYTASHVPASYGSCRTKETMLSLSCWTVTRPSPDVHHGWAALPPRTTTRSPRLPPLTLS